MLLGSACKRKETNLTQRPDRALIAIDSQLWRQPDSALMNLLTRMDSIQEGTYDWHYANLLLAELLYKNDYEQTNREELLQSVDYFDSLSKVRDASASSVFLDARAHYINGVGYYELDSVVDACKEYLQTLEVMEQRFPCLEKHNVHSLPKIPHIPRFMALTYNRLGDMFSDHYMMESAIACYENALEYCKIEPTSNTGASNNLYRIGKLHDMMGDTEKSRQYYENALDEMPDTDNCIYRDIAAITAIDAYRQGQGIDSSTLILRQTISEAESEDEVLTRYLSMGSLYFLEGCYDSAASYLEPVFHYSEQKPFQMQAADYLRSIFDSLGNKPKSDECAQFLSRQRKTDAQNKALVSQLDGLLQNYSDLKQQKQTANERRRNIGITFILAMIASVVIFIAAKLKSRKLLKEQHRKHFLEQSAMSNRLKQSNYELKELKAREKQKRNDSESKSGLKFFA